MTNFHSSVLQHFRTNWVPRITKNMSNLVSSELLFRSLKQMFFSFWSKALSEVLYAPNLYQLSAFPLVYFSEICVVEPAFLPPQIYRSHGAVASIFALLHNWVLSSWGHPWHPVVLVLATRIVDDSFGFVCSVSVQDVQMKKWRFVLSVAQKFFFFLSLHEWSHEKLGFLLSNSAELRVQREGVHRMVCPWSFKVEINRDQTCTQPCILEPGLPSWI